MINEELVTIQQRCAIATPGPWTCDPREGSRCVAILEDEKPRYNTYVNAQEHTGRSSTEEDGEFIAHAREDIPALLAEIKRLQDDLDQLWGESAPHESGDECLRCRRLATETGYPWCDQCFLETCLEYCNDAMEIYQEAMDEKEESDKLLSQG